MRVVLFHTGCVGPYINCNPNGPNLPSHLEHCFRQYRLFNTGPLYFLTDRQNFPDLEQYGWVVPVPIQDYTSDKIARFNSLYNSYGPRNFWTVAATRLFYIENYMRRHEVRDVYHFENDVLVYFDIKKFDLLFRRLYRRVAVTPGGPNKYMTGFMYIPSADSLKRVTDFFINILEVFGTHGLERDMSINLVQEMALLWLCGQLTSHIDILPILPFGPYSQHYEEFVAVFDPASWGQFVGGTRTEGPGAKPDDHHIGQLLMKHPGYGVEWQTHDGLRLPYFVHSGNYVKINNLHIHSKNLKGFMSRC